MMIERKQIIDQLQKGAVRVVFKKQDGTEREMICTLSAELIPKNEIEKLQTKRKFSETALRVWDLDKMAWRSFIIESLILINGETI
jgi:hypothetical protein